MRMDNMMNGGSMPLTTNSLMMILSLNSIWMMMNLKMRMQMMTNQDRSCKRNKDMTLNLMIKDLLSWLDKKHQDNSWTLLWKKK